MSGITVGPRQFNMMTAGTYLTGVNDIGAWRQIAQPSGTGNTYYNTQKLDLRGLNGGSDSSRGFNPLAFSLQESTSWHATSTEDPPLPPTWWVYDMVTTVPLNPTTISNIMQYPITNSNNSTPAFLAQQGRTVTTGADKEVAQYLNTSQVIWGRWRLWMSQSAGAGPTIGTDKFSTLVSQSGTWGSGEVMVSNDAYYTRVIICAGDPTLSVYTPSSNLAIWGEVISLSEGQELTQLSRMVQR